MVLGPVNDRRRAGTAAADYNGAALNYR